MLCVGFLGPGNVSESKIVTKFDGLVCDVEGGVCGVGLGGGAGSQEVRAVLVDALLEIATGSEGVAVREEDIEVRLVVVEVVEALDFVWSLCIDSNEFACFLGCC